MNKKIIVIVILVVFILAIMEVGIIYAYYIHKDKAKNNFKMGGISVTIDEPNYTNNQIMKPNTEIKKDPTFTNNGETSVYIRAQVYVPMLKLNYIKLGEIVEKPSEEIELFTYKINPNWVLVEDDDFNGIYEDNNHNKYKVYTYKFVDSVTGEEKVIEKGESIDTPLFNSIKVINYMDTDKKIDVDLDVYALATQTEGGTSDELWEFFKNQNGRSFVRKLDDEIKE